MLALLAPGQGSQTPGFLAPWLESNLATSLINTWSSATDLDLTRLGSTALADEIRDTSKAQPLLVAGALIGADFCFEGDYSNISYFVGHSVGEIGVAALAQVIDATSAMTLVRTRGIEMAKAAEGTNTGMSAVLGGEREVVVAALVALGLTPANENGAGQIVAAGSLEALAKLAENPPEGSRVRVLAVSGAFHTSTMSPAIPVLAEMAKNIEVNEPVLPIISNKDGAIIDNGQDVIDRIVGQITRPVRWDLCMATMAKSGVTGIIELPPSGTLAGLIKRAQPTIETFLLKTPDDIPAAREFAKKHGGR